jgi:hypothetical protein
LDYFFCFAKHKLGVMWSLPQEWTLITYLM